MKPDALVGVQMHSYNSHATLPRALQSVFRQSLFLSSPDRMRVLGVVPEADRKTQGIFQQYGADLLTTGYADAVKQRTAGFQHLNTKYIFSLGSDDTLYPNTLMSMLLAAEKHEADVVFSNYEQWSLDGRFLGAVDLDADMDELQRRCFVTDTCLFRKYTWNKLGGFDDEMWRYSAWDYFLRLHADGGKFVHVPFNGFRYYIHDGQISQKQKRGEYKERDGRAYARFCKVRGLTNPVTLGHGA